MKFNGSTEIGSAEIGPVVFRTKGDLGLAKKYLYRGRVLLGDMKRRMQLNNDIKWLQQDHLLPDGTFIHTQSNRYGLRDIDEVWIDAPIVAGEKVVHGPDTCLGYIVQGFIDQEAPTGYINAHYMRGSDANWVSFRLRTETGFTDTVDTLNSDYFVRWWNNDFAIYIPPDIAGWQAYQDFNDVYAGFTDNNAKYVTVATVTPPSIYPDPAWSGIGNMQSIYAAQATIGGTTQYIGVSYNLPGYYYTYNLQLIRNADSKGFASNSGLRFGETYELTDINSNEGSGFLFMMPTDTTHQFKYADNLVDYNLNMLTAPSVLTGFDGMSFQGDFGIPVTVESGLHRIQPGGWQSVNAQFSLKVTLLFKNAGKVTIDIAKDDIAPSVSGIYTPKELQIDVRDLTASETPNDLVKVVDLTY
jgi:hypothetical protein